MLRSWTKWLASNSSARETIGVAVTQRQVAAACLQHGAQRPKVKWVRNVALQTELFKGTPTVAQARGLREVFSNLLPEQRRKHIPIHVALPDPTALIVVSEVDNVPRTKPLREQLVRWHMSKEFGVREGEVEVATQEFGDEGEKRLLFGQAISVDWLNLLREALTSSELTAWSVNQAACARFNGFHRVFSTGGMSGAMLTVDADAWTTVVWDSVGRLRFLRSRWRELNNENFEQEAVGIVDEFRQSVLAYSHSTSRSVQNIHVSASSTERDVVADLLNKHLDGRLTVLTPDVEDPSWRMRDASASLATIVAMTE